jgi:hypothetical protein
MDKSESEDAFMPSLLLREPLLLVLVGEMDTTRVERERERVWGLSNHAWVCRPWHGQGTWIYRRVYLLAGERSVSEDWVMGRVGKGMGVRD